MITRKPSKIIDSVVNSSHEEHLNVSKAIRDDAPITNLTSCVKSINFEADGDGAYILRKPLVKKESLKSLTDPITYPFEFYLFDKEHKVTVSEITEEVDEEEITNRVLQIPGASKIILKFYDNDMIEHKIEFNGNSITVNWLAINSTFNTSDHTIINGIINHRTFLDNYSYTTLVNITTSKWAWTLVNATTWNAYIPGRVSKTLTNLKRFLKIYESVDEENTFILEIVHPELNTFTSGLDVGNTEALETNLLLDNPYAIRDLYGYGYISVTKIVPYVLNTTEVQEDAVEIETLNRYRIWDLTENDFAPNEAQIPYQHFRMLVSTNPNVFDKRYLILKAFLTTAVSNVDYYCCWEESKNGGIDWEVCQEFIDKFELTEEDEQTVSDLTAKEFNEMVYKESLTEAQSYIVKKKLYHMIELKTKDYHQDDCIEYRPDVLILENPDLSKLYRFTIYINSNTPTPEPTVETFTKIQAQFDTLSGQIGNDPNILYEVIDNSEHATVDSRCLLLQSGTQVLPAPVDGVYPQYYPDIGVGDALHIYTENALCKIKSVTYTLAPSRIDTEVTPNKTYDVGAFIGISSYLSTSLSIPSSAVHGDVDYLYENMYGTATTIKYSDNEIDSISTDIENTIKNNWVNASQTKTYLIPNVDASTNVYLLNIFNTLYEVTCTKYFPGPFLETGEELTFLTIDLYLETTITYIKDEATQTLTTSVTPSVVSANDLTQIYIWDVIRVVKLDSGKFRIQPRRIKTIRTSPFTVLSTENLASADDVDEITIQYTAGYTKKYISTGDTLWPITYEYYSNVTYSSSDEYTRVPTLSTSKVYTELASKKHITITSPDQALLKIKDVTVTYSLTSDTPFTSVYLTSQTGSYQIPYSNTTELTVDLTSERDKIFAADSNFYYNENQAQLLVYNDNFVYASGTNSAVMKLMNSLSLPEEVTKIISWRGYLLLFSLRNIYLAKYNSSIDGYDVKVLSNTVGVSKEDADTIVPVLNSVYFKSGNKIYKLVPNLYAASDDILNIHQVSTGINNILEDITNVYEETHNFSYADADTYMVFIPIQASNMTICICYDFVKQVWTMQKYSKYLNDIEKFSNIEIYLKDNESLYYFKDSMSKIIAEARTSGDPSLDILIHAIPYSDYLSSSPSDLINIVKEEGTIADFELIRTPIVFEIDFGQKSSNYTMDKQFLETKMILATLSSKDNFPLTLDIYTDGVSRELHWDVNTDGALIKTGLDSYGVLNTSFVSDDADYNGIFKQLIVKYSGKGKSIRHVISGQSKSLFKFYSMNVRARILPKKH